MAKRPWQQPALWGAALSVATISYHLARRGPTNRSAGGATPVGGIDVAAFVGDTAEAIDPELSAKLRERIRSGDSAESIAKDVKRALGHGIEMFTPDGRINGHLTETAGIPQERVAAVQKAFDDTAKAASASLRSRMVPDPERTHPEKRIDAYRIPADPTAADRLLGDLKQALVSTCGETAAAILIEIYEPEYRFAGFGRYDVALTREPGLGVHSQAGQPDVVYDTGGFGYVFAVTEPASSKEVMRMSCSEGHERKNFGTLLEPPPWK